MYMISASEWSWFILCVSTLWGCSHRALQHEGSVTSPDTESGVARVREDGYEAAVTEEREDEAIQEDVYVAKTVLNISQEKETRSIYTVIDELESCYCTSNYEKWTSLLTPNYRQHLNNRQILEAEGWQAENIRGFFNLLVQTRRKSDIGDLDVSRVDFVSDTKAYVYVVLDGEEFPTPQHTFIRIDDSRLKGLSYEGE